MDERIAKFNYYEKILFRIYLSVVGMGFILFILLYTALDTLGKLSDLISGFIVMIIGYLIITFFLSIVRLFVYLKLFIGKIDAIGIKRTVITIFTSPIVTAMYFFILILLALSLASCTFQ